MTGMATRSLSHQTHQTAAGQLVSDTCLVLLGTVYVPSGKKTDNKSWSLSRKISTGKVLVPSSEKYLSQAVSAHLPSLH